MATASNASRALASLADAANLHAQFNTPANAEPIARMADHMLAALKSGGKLLACGNGGSLCDSAHFVEELTGRFRKDRPPIAAIACADAGHITCTANDYGFDVVFSRWITALARKGDCVLLLSTSGNSPNILLAAKAARDAGATVLGLAGKGGGKLAAACDVCLTCPGQTADRIQELHKLALHTFVELIEAGLGYA